MCEIAVYNPAYWKTEDQFGLANDMFVMNPDGLGFVAIYRADDRFEYVTYKAERPTYGLILRFLDNNQDAWRIAVHARLATAGGTGDSQTHPIHVPCPKCEPRMVIHNGMVRKHYSIRQEKVSMGHKFKTTVDTEVIAHRHASVPDDLDDLQDPDISGILNYLVFCDDKILVRSGVSYTHSDDFRMGKRATTRPANGRSDKEWLLVKPDGSVDSKKIQYKKEYTRGRKTTLKSGNGMTGGMKVYSNRYTRSPGYSETGAGPGECRCEEGGEHGYTGVHDPDCTGACPTDDRWGTTQTDDTGYPPSEEEVWEWFFGVDSEVVSDPFHVDENPDDF